MIKTINGSGRTWEMRFSIFNLGWATTRNRFNKLFIGTWLSGLTSKFRATADRREGPSQLMVDSTKVTSLKAPTGNWAKRIPTATASTRPASSLSSLLTSDQTQSISHSLLFVDTLSLRDLAAMATKSRQTFFHYVFFLIGSSAPFPIPEGMIERSLHLPPCLTAHKLSFLKLWSVCSGRGIRQLEHVLFFFNL